jgi:hypothetical protein
MLVDTATFLGLAKVLRVEGVRLRLEAGDREIDALLATPYPYRPAAGDTVVALGQAEPYFVIGVLHGEGTTSFTAPGNLELRATGTIDLRASKGVRITSPDVSVRAGTLRLIAKSVTEKFVDAARWVRDAFQLRAGRVRQVVDGKYSLQAERIHERAKDDVKIDGRKIDLG